MQLPNFRVGLTPDLQAGIYRSACLTQVIGQDLGEYLQDLHIRTVLDLRRPQEYSAEEIITYREFLESYGIQYLNYPFGDMGDLGIDISQLTLAQVGDNLYYEWLPRYQAYIFKDIIKLLLMIPSPLLIHCSAGRDRTGMVVAVLQLLMDFQRDDILADYCLSPGSRVTNMELFLDTIADLGGIHRILNATGMDSSEISQFQQNYGR